MIFGAVEAGGTKFVCGVGSAESGSLETVRIETGTVDATLAEVIAFFRGAAERHGPITAIGIGSFGPLDLDHASPTYGRITTTPKPGWADVDLPELLRRALAVPVQIDTDVNAAAMAEGRYGAGRGAATVAYVTVGTGIGIGIAHQTAAAAGAHAEAGHLLLRPHSAHAGFAGICPFHGDCLEGLASGPALKAFWGTSLDKLPADHEAWDVQADYLAQLCAVLTLTLAPDRIVMGGGVMTGSALFDRIRKGTAERLAGYVERLADPALYADYIVPPACQEPPGLIGAYILAAQARG